MREVMDQQPPLAVPFVQSALLAEAARNADVGFLVWDDDRRYVAANAKACSLLGCTVEQLIGSEVGTHSQNGAATVERVVQAGGGIGEIAVTGFDGRELRLGYVSFTTRIASVQYMGSIVWPV
jgi:PAS domain-containing protein